MAALVVLVRRHRRAVGAAVRRVLGDEVPGAVEEAGPAAVRRVPPGLLDELMSYFSSYFFIGYYTPGNKRRTRAPVLTGVPGAAPVDVASKNG